MDRGACRPATPMSAACGDRCRGAGRLGANRTPLLGAILVAVFLSGCASSEYVTLRDTPKNPLASSLNLVARGGPKATSRTKQLLRRNNLSDRLNGNQGVLLASLEAVDQQEPNRENHYAMAEVAYIAAKRAEKSRPGRALEFYGTSLLHAYSYLFDASHEPVTNPYDPQFRSACDLYNQSLEGMLRLVLSQGEIKPGTSQVLQTANNQATFDVVLHSSGWRNEDCDRLEFVSDYRVGGLQNHYQRYGLGVPLIAVRSKSEETDLPSTSAEQYYPPRLSFPVTAFLRVTSGDEPRLPSITPVSYAASVDLAMLTGSAQGETKAAQDKLHFVLELHDPLDRQTVQIANREVPLEADLSTPLAYFLSQPGFAESKLGTLGLLLPEKAEKLQGLYMLEPFDPHKMPVVMVHGLWSSPVTWMEMFNDLRSDPLVRQHYQFWFYLYPTGQPFWFSAAQMRADMAEVRERLDPQRRLVALDQTVLVGHSMGGLVSKLQSVDSEETLWSTLSERPIEELDAAPEVMEGLAATFFFDPDPSVRRVVTIGTPHRGSEFANDLTRWLGRRLIALPKRIAAGRQQLVTRNRDFFRPDAPLDVTTSIDSLAPDSPLLPALLEADPAQWVSYHNIVGEVPLEGWRSYFVSEGDGVVALASATLEGRPQLRSQMVVPADHVTVHRHPQSILEVRRILFEQLAELENFPYGTTVARAADAAAQPAGGATQTGLASPQAFVAPTGVSSPSPAATPLSSPWPADGPEPATYSPGILRQ